MAVASCFQRKGGTHVERRSPYAIRHASVQTFQAPLREGDADDRNLEISSFHDRIDCREDHLMGEISRDTEEDRVRTGDGHQLPAFLRQPFPEPMPGYLKRAYNFILSEWSSNAAERLTDRG